MSIFKAQIDHHSATNMSLSNSCNDIYSFSYEASKANNNMLYFHQAMQSEDAKEFYAAIAKEIASFKEKKIFNIDPIDSKRKVKSLISFT